MNNDIIKVLIYETKQFLGGKMKNLNLLKQFLGGKMKNLNLLIKPASSSCNLRCRYCFYYDVADNREVKNYGIMNDDTLENMVKKVFDDVEYSANFAFQGGEPTMAGIEFFEKFHKFVEKYNTKKIIVNFSLQTNGTLLNKNFAFQGGEPTMAGIEFFEKFHKFVEKYNTKKIIVNFSLQTNGTLLNKKWLELFKKHNYLIGLSLDGNKEMHDTFRIDAKGEGTFSRVLKAAKMMKKAEVEFNILCVVNKLIAQNGKLVYNFFRNNGFRYYQFIPCLDSLSCSEEKDYTLTAEDYGKFLDETFNLWYEDMMSGKRISVRHFDNYTKILLGEEPEACDMVGDYGKFLDETFNLWYEDMMSGKRISVRHFDNYTKILLGEEPEACDMVGHCNMNAVLESDGSMYPCDFYVLDEFKVGNINESSFEELFKSEAEMRFLSFEELFKSEAEMRFLRTSLAVDEKCKVCRYFKICRGGCRRHKELTAEGNYENRFCESYKYFFERNIDKMIKTAEYVMKIRRENFIKNK